MSLWTVAKAQEWLDSYDMVSSGSGNREGDSHKSLIKTWLERAGYSSLDQKLSKVKLPKKAEKKEVVETTSKGKKQSTTLTNVMDQGFDSFLNVL